MLELVLELYWCTKVYKAQPWETALKTSAEAAIKIPEETTLKTAEEAPLKTESMCSSGKLAVNVSLCTSSHTCTTDVTPSQPENTKANIGVTPSQPEDTFKTTKSATKFKEQLSPSYDTPGFGEPAKLQCPTCIKVNIQGSFFCSQDCFKGNWDLHKLHKNKTCNTSAAHSLMASTVMYNWPVPPSSKCNKATTAGGVY
jgi:hypothetical protein